ncbi:glycosyltransferase [Candidatus Bathyarchaeota archaeon]|nr:glycosyltransferase [Candidatus Bathyarchaeota archaeon]
MTFTSTYGYRPKKKKKLIAPKQVTPKEITVVIPVKDNQKGIDNFLKALIKTHRTQEYPRQIIIIDDRSKSTEILDKYHKELDILLLHSDKRGPAAARNIGWKKAKTNWILFTDSDCIPRKNWINGYNASLDGSIGYAGNVKAYGNDYLSQYYESQNILIPAPYTLFGIEYPEFLVTANALVWKPALREINGFNEEIYIAAGEDVDLGFRLREIGELRYALESIINHNFDDGLEGFKKRFYRYGQGNKRISEIYNIDLTPQPFKPKIKTPGNVELASIQHKYITKGYKKGL